MSGGKAGSSRATLYHMRLQYAVCQGPVDRVVEVFIGDRKVPQASANGANTVHRGSYPGLFGGVRKEGGVAGAIWMFLGAVDQVLPDYARDLIARGGVLPNGVEIRDRVPGYRRLCSILLTENFGPEADEELDEDGALIEEVRSQIVVSGEYTQPETDAFYFGANNPFVKPLSARVTRKPGVWYPSRVEIFYKDKTTTRRNVNPVHIIRELQTDPVIGRGVPESSLDEAGYRAAARTLFDEDFGVSFVWDRSSDEGEVIEDLLALIDGTLYTDLSTGKLTIGLNRGGYDRESLPILDATNSRLGEISYRDLSDTVGEVVVQYTNPENEQIASVTVQDLANINAKGGRVDSVTLRYPQIRNIELATDVAYRELAAGAAFLVTGDIEISPALVRECHPGALFRLQFPTYRGVDDVVVRLSSPELSDTGFIRTSFAQDVYDTNARSDNNVEDDLGDFLDDQEGSVLPSPARQVQGINMPFGASQALGLVSDAEQQPYAVYLASPDTNDVWGFDIERLGDVVDVAPAASGVLANPLSLGLTSALPSLAQSSPEFPSTEESNFWIIGDREADAEIAYVVLGASGLELRRGVYDTVPKAWPAGSPVWQIPNVFSVYDPAAQTPFDTFDLRALTKTSLGTLDSAEATPVSFAVTDRHERPLRPAGVTMGGSAFTSPSSPLSVVAGSSVSLSWDNRDRFLEDAEPLAWDAGATGLEMGQQSVVVLTPTVNMVPQDIAIVPGSTYALDTTGLATGDYVVEVFADRGSLRSLQALKHYLKIT